ncbi:Zn-ribbon domain-containing OB-fold protein [Rhodococcus qingshengii]|uniref:Zn-ribbon domain-containing OB-fold protein n=1 Tax=Rhodococcus qingshengii TaxID=334542 RepID=UPI0036D75AF8
MSLLQLQRDTWSAPFFDAAALGELVILRCQDCNEWSAPQARRCAFCSSDRVTWTKVTGQGEVVSWTAPHLREGQTTKPAYVVAIVQLPEGPWIYVQSRADIELRVGQVVTIEFASIDGGEHLPVISVPR